MQPPLPRTAWQFNQKQHNSKKYHKHGIVQYFNCPYLCPRKCDPETSDGNPETSDNDPETSDHNPETSDNDPETSETDGRNKICNLNILIYKHLIRKENE
jgi:hypothetical protein